MKHRIVVFVGILVALANTVSAQLQITPNITPEKLVRETLLGNRVEVRNIKYKGAERAIASFSDSAAHPLMAEGIMLTTGIALGAAGPNQRSGMSANNGTPGDYVLKRLGNGPTYDAASLEFDFVPEMELLSFNFVFASEEYVEYVNSQFNDVFAFLISGPGIKGQKNLAIIPGTRYPITVNTINHISHRKNYIDNNYFGRRGQRIKGREEYLNPHLIKTYEFDGLTTLLQAETRVRPGETYHIKIAIADVSDSRYDSAVFLEAGSFTSLPSDPIEREEILLREFADVRRMADPVRVGEKPTYKIETEVAKVDTVPEPTPTLVDGWKVAVEFDFNVSQLDAAGKEQLRAARDYIKSHPEKSVHLAGHTDDVGSKSYNVRLSKKRAEAVRRHLIRLGIPARRIVIDWHDFEQPLIDQETDFARARNRRVEVVLR